MILARRLAGRSCEPVRFAMVIGCLAADVEKAVGMISLQYRRKVRARVTSTWTVLN